MASTMTCANSTTATGNGENGDLIAFNIPTYMAIAAFTAVAWFNVIELNVQVFMTFKRHRGLYFWSLIISSYGCILHALGFLLKFFQLTDNDFLSVTIITIGWYAMVTGQAIVLYSRLHLVVREHRVLRGVLIMIIVDAICFHIPTTVLTYGSNSNNSASFINAFNVMERLQMTAFSIQEFIISGIYVYSTIKLLRPVYHGRTRRVMMQLIWINLTIIAMDVVLLTFEYNYDYEIEATLKAMVYSIKLKLEFAVLNQLMTLANASVHSATNLTYDDPSNPPATNPSLRPRPRSKSLTCLSKLHPKALFSSSRPSLSSKTYLPSETHARSASSTTSTSALWPSRRSNSGSDRTSDHKWIPSLDRNYVVSAQHVEHAAPLNAYTNPAAFPNAFPPSSPTLSGSTLSHSGHSGRSRYYRPRPPSLFDLGAPSPALTAGEFGGVGGAGVLRSSRPSVSDWAHGPDEDSSPSVSSSEGRLELFEKAAVGLQRGMSVRAANGRERAMGLDFMTSAL
ncbi:hypothetical protein MMC34_006117 [Xylographa carneopallida]|nr:hypothetical protein [Xylographa carneopallida]